MRPTNPYSSPCLFFRKPARLDIYRGSSQNPWRMWLSVTITPSAISEDMLFNLTTEKTRWMPLNSFGYPQGRAPVEICRATSCTRRHSILCFTSSNYPNRENFNNTHRRFAQK